MTTRIAMLVDFSPASMKALHHCAALAQKLQACVDILHAYEVPADTSAEAGEQAVAERQARTEGCARVLELLGVRDVRARLEVVSGNLPASLAALVAWEDYDFVFVGKSSRGWLSRLVTGSVTRELLDGCECPVLVVAEDSRPPVSTLDGRAEPRGSRSVSHAPPPSPWSEAHAAVGFDYDAFDYDEPTHSDLPPEVVQPMAGLRVLVVDDDPDMRALLGMSLRKVGCDVTEARDGVEASALLASAAQHPPDIVVTDVMMPRRSGIGLLEEINRLGLRVPVVLISAMGSDALGPHAEHLGAAAVLTKPVDMDSVTSTVSSVVRGARASLHPTF